MGFSQMKKRTRDIFALLEFLHDYVPESDQAKWLRTPNDSLGGRSPLDALAGGEFHQLIAEIRRMQEGQPG